MKIDHKSFIIFIQSVHNVIYRENRDILCRVQMSAKCSLRNENKGLKKGQKSTMAKTLIYKCETAISHPKSEWQEILV